LLIARLEEIFHMHSKLKSALKGSASITALEHDLFAELALQGHCHVIDVREPHEFAAGRIPGAQNVPLSSAFDPARLPKDKPVVLVCQAGGRSARALDAAHRAGRTDVVHYAPGTAGWIGRGGKVHR
jgi:rhodanese-related sulfurtransferase